MKISTDSNQSDLIERARAGDQRALNELRESKHCVVWTQRALDALNLYISLKHELPRECQVLKNPFHIQVLDSHFEQEVEALVTGSLQVQGSFHILELIVKGKEESPEYWICDSTWGGFKPLGNVTRWFLMKD